MTECYHIANNAEFHYANCRDAECHGAMCVKLKCDKFAWKLLVIFQSSLICLAAWVNLSKKLETMVANFLKLYHFSDVGKMVYT